MSAKWGLLLAFAIVVIVWLWLQYKPRPESSNTREHWATYPRQQDGHSTSILYDEAVSDTLKASSPPRNLLKIQIPFKKPHANGMPTNEEFPHLNAAEDTMVAEIRRNSGLYVGRITKSGYRDLYVYTSETAQIWEPRIRAISAQTGYPFTYSITSDEKYSGYWHDLYPGEDDRQVVEDIKVLEILKRAGDQPSEARTIDHWAYFDTKANAEVFAAWLKEQGYSGMDLRVQKDRYCVQFSHTGTTQLNDISAHTVALRRKTSELSGDYDGWETVVCREPKERRHD